MPANCVNNNIDSNGTGLNWAWEVCPGELPQSTAGTAATGTLTFTGTAANGDTVTIGAKTYTFKTTLSTGPTVANEVVVGGTAVVSRNNLVAAINAGAGIGTTYSTGTTANASVTASNGTTGTSALLTAKAAGVAGNSVATTETSTNLNFGGGTLAGGVDGVENPPVWKAFEPNSYNDFGGQVTTVARNPINDSRQQEKGVVTDLDASGTFTQDLTNANTQEIMQGYMAADFRSKGGGAVTAVDAGASTVTVNAQGAATVAVSGPGTGYAVGQVLVARGDEGTYDAPVRLRITSVGANGVITGLEIAQPGAYTTPPTNPVALDVDGPRSGTNATASLTFTQGAAFATNDLVLLEGFSQDGNNALFTVTAKAGNVLTVSGDSTLVADTDLSTARLVKVGHMFAVGDVTVVADNGALPVLASTAADFRNLGLTPGEFVYVGSDNTPQRFPEDDNNGFKRVRSISQHALVIDKSDAPMVDADGAGIALCVFFGRHLKNELAPLIKDRTVQLERTLGSLDGLDPPQAEYVIGAEPSQATFTLNTAAIATVEMQFMGRDVELHTQAEGLKNGLRPAGETSDAYNTSSDVARIKMARVVPGDAAPAPLFGFAQTMTLVINRNITANKAIGRVGSISNSHGTFAVSGSITAYFSDIDAMKAVRQNADVTLDFVMVKSNKGIAFDVPLITLGNARANVQLNNPITIPLDQNAARGRKIDAGLDYTLGVTFFPYLPTEAS